MMGLLVSVRNAAEALDALAGGADLIDVKEPTRGALGAADLNVWRKIQAAIGERVPLSAALGELLGQRAFARAAQTHGFSFAKIGLAGCAQIPRWQDRWRRALERLPPGVAPVAVAYADHQGAAAPSPDEVLAAAAEVGAGILLLDTFDKRVGNLLEQLSLAQLERFALAARVRKIDVVLAGSLAREMLASLAPLAPLYFAVRGAACAAGRTSAVDRQKVVELKSSLVKSCSDFQLSCCEKTA
jgi:uncharacterized protein (UPF0264 family)